MQFLLSFDISCYFASPEKRLVSSEPALDAELLVVVEDLEDLVSLEKRPDAAELATDDVIEDASREESEERVESTEDEFSEVTRLFEPEMRLVRKDVLPDSFVVVSIPLALLTIVAMFLMLVTLVRSSLPSAEYWV